jgi:hypothetical protein
MKKAKQIVIRPIFNQDDSIPIFKGVRWFPFLLLQPKQGPHQQHHQQLQPLQSIHFLQSLIIIIIKYIYMFLSFYDLD